MSWRPSCLEFLRNPIRFIVDPQARAVIVDPTADVGRINIINIVIVRFAWHLHVGRELDRPKDDSEKHARAESVTEK